MATTRSMTDWLASEVRVQYGAVSAASIKDAVRARMVWRADRTLGGTERKSVRDSNSTAGHRTPRAGTTRSEHTFPRVAIDRLVRTRLGSECPLTQEQKPSASGTLFLFGPGWPHGGVLVAFQLIGFSRELFREPAELLLSAEIETIPRSRPAPHCQHPEIARCHFVQHVS